MSDPLYPSATSFPGESGTTTTGNTGTQDFKHKVSEVTSQAKQKASELGRTTADTIDRNLDTAAGKLQQTADSLRGRAGMGTDKMSQLAGTAAEKLDATARYLREHNSRDMVSGFDQMIRRNPGASLAAALAVGFLLGSAMKKDRY